MMLNSFLFEFLGKSNKNGKLLLQTKTHLDLKSFSNIRNYFNFLWNNLNYYNY